MSFSKYRQPGELNTQVAVEIQLPAVNQGLEASRAHDLASAPPGTQFGLTIFVGAFLLFEVQPMIAKIVVPWFGGSSAVWTTCLLFFQALLLLGYLYAYWLIGRLRPRVQTRVHLALLALGLLALPILPSDAWKPVGPERPALHILSLLAAAVGLPYFVLSTSSPLIQAWYAQACSGAKPYRLFALSNAGAMLALVTYPVLVEPVFSTRHQAIGWSLAFAGFCGLCGTLAVGARSTGPAREAATRQSRPSWALQALWVALTACASTLLLAITNHLSQNIAPVPFLWVLPLSLYLLSFILCFEGRGWYRRGLFLWALGVALGGMAYTLSSPKAPLALLIPLYCAGLFVCSMVCHGELARLKPPPEHLTSFYLMCSAGGATGGIFVGLFAPYLFRGFFELPIGLACCAVLALVVLYRDPGSRFYKARWQPAGLVLVLLTLTLIVVLTARIRKSASAARVMVRNFYGSLKVNDEDDSDSEDSTRELVNGTTQHGKEFLAPSRRLQPTTYYGPDSGVGLVLRLAGRQGGLRVGVIGLGAGTLAAFGRPGDHYTFYEINPLVIELARTEFYFLRDSPAKVDIVPGDGRLSLERQPIQDFDVLVVDAFSGDAIPVHLLTREAFILYFRHLKPRGTLAVHVSNQYLDLRPVVRRAAESLGKQAVGIESEDDDENAIFRAMWVLVSGRQEFFSEPDIRKYGAAIPSRANLRLWTDDYSSLFGVLK